jgi:hypothetical protein
MPGTITRVSPIGYLPESETMADGTRYIPGACNIGPYEIRRRRLFGVLGLTVAGILAVALVASAAPWFLRLAILLPLWGGLISWLQARRRFCVGYARLGIRNLGPDDSGRESVEDADARTADRAAASRLIREAFLLALPPAVLLAILPL